MFKLPLRYGSRKVKVITIESSIVITFAFIIVLYIWNAFFNLEYIYMWYVIHILVLNLWSVAHNTLKWNYDIHLYWQVLGFYGNLGPFYKLGFKAF